jgi:FkbM family methyltransferase
MGDAALKTLDPSVKYETRYCIPLWVRDEQIRANIKRAPGRIQAGEDTDEPCAIVGYGPSLAKTWKQVRKFKTIITCSGAHKFLLERGITPTMHIEVDPREHKIELLGEPHPDVTYYPASCVHPKYLSHLLDHGAQVKLWHVFAKDGESEQVIPRGEFMVTGGCDVGMRAMTIARFLGHKKLHIFGLDGSEGDTGKHAGKHPNQPKASLPTIVNGREFRSTPALLESAKMVFHELDQLHDVEFKFYGDGMIQEMAKTYQRKPAHPNSMLAAVKPRLISDEMRELNARLHTENPYYGSGGSKYAETVLKMKTQEINSILDYGCGKSQLAKSLPFPIWQYDPAVPEFSETPRPADLVVCTDVLEHVEPEHLQFVLDDLRRCVLQVGYFVIHLGAAKKTYADGRNAHLIQQPASWWKKKLERFFDIATAQQNGNDLHVVVAPRTAKDDPSAIMGVRGKDGIKSRFHTPNETTRWRAETLTTKEPITLDWIESMRKGETMWDVGANVGGYTVWAGVRGVNVIAFEPEAENYALLNRNIALNNLDATAYCLALSDRRQFNQLHLSARQLGGSCHTFGAETGPHGDERHTGLVQGCFATTIDDLIAQGLPAPDHIKIDVDGLEGQVIAGASRLLASGKVKTLLIETNPKLESHTDMIEWLEASGYWFDPAQAEASARKDGPFKGCAEIVFHAPVAEAAQDLGAHIRDAIANARIIAEPFPHMVVEGLFPADVFRDIAASLPPDAAYASLEAARGTKGYPQRYVHGMDDEPLSALSRLLRQGWLKSLLCAKFGILPDCSDEAVLLRDFAGYRIGPHCDTPAKIVTALIYLRDASAGTTLYEPKDKTAPRELGRHYPFAEFEPVATVPAKANSALIFLNGPQAFHGVEPFEGPGTRDILLYDLRAK